MENPRLKKNLLAAQQRLVDSGESVTPVPVVPGWQLALVGGELVLVGPSGSITVETANFQQHLQMSMKLRGLLDQIGGS